MTTIISIANFKGGVGKTTSTINIGAGLAKKKKKVLLIDLDPQFNLSQSLGINEAEKPIYGALRGQYPLEPINVTKNLDVVPSSLDLIKAQIELSHEFKRESILTKLLEPIKERYDFILLDCPPSLGLLTINAFVASDKIFVPIESEFLALKGYTILGEAISQVGLEIDKVFITRYDSRKILNRNVHDSVKDALKEKAFKTVIRSNVTLAEAPSNGIDIYRYSPKSNGAKDYGALVKEVIAYCK
ncbi:ParA family protein [Aureispira sp. CCB-QB1]|uniref:ParA family protein n=1 Tax=Aureispira sp. CCB-QB1 TaxID=1313421 RepID=UPI000697B180|nr:ParA family protein [Aureispira sp. CCB-QB1]